jgi:murein DD-endopeptidase MepM/ murein hydrolase activator NlpD
MSISKYQYSLRIVLSSVISICFFSGINVSYSFPSSISERTQDKKNDQLFSYSNVMGYPLAKESQITSGFGRRNQPTKGASLFHAGVDLAAPFGTPVIATQNGIVKLSEFYGGYGNTVILGHREDIKTLYAHLSTINVSVGESVTKGQVIGSVGSSGVSTGPHLHYEVRLGSSAVNPINYLGRLPSKSSKRTIRYTIPSCEIALWGRCEPSSRDLN